MCMNAKVLDPPSPAANKNTDYARAANQAAF